ncbi:MAG: molybdopterin-dependent oxidoreductase, partial [Deltaproteobacteria bacterium]
MIEIKKSFCRFCHVFCGIEVDVEDNRVLAVRGDPDNAVSQGYTCLKGRAEIERIYHPKRLLSSRKRIDNSWTDIAIEQALDEIAVKLKEIVDQYGPRSVAVYAGCGAHRTSAGGPWLAGRWLDALGSPSLYTSFTIDSPGMLVAWTRLFGGPVPVNLFDISNADVAMFVGTNPTISHFPSMPQSNPFKRLNDAQKRGMKLIVIDPRRSYIARRADIHLQVKPGEDATLLAGLIKIIIEKKLYDKEYVASCVGGVDELYESVKDFDLEYISRRTQIPADLIPKAAEIFATAKSGAAQSGTGLHMARHQNLTTQLVMTLNALCGRIDRRGGLTRNEGPLGIEIPEDMVAVPMPLHTNHESRVRGIKGTMSWLGFYPEMPTNTLTDEILIPGEGKVRALIVHGGNPALVFPDEESTVRAMKELDLLVVNDLFMSATAKFAHYVIAVKHPFERADVPRLMDINYPFPFGQYSPPLVEAPEGVIEDWETFWGLAERLNLQLDLPEISMDRKPAAEE